MRILFVSLCTFPDSVAMATRIQMEALALYRAGARVSIVGVSSERSTFMYRDIRVDLLPTQYSEEKLRRLSREKYLWPQLESYIVNENIKEKIDVVITSGFGITFCKKIPKLLSKLSIKMIANETDWFEYHNFARGLRRPFYYLSSEYTVRIINRKALNIFVISSYLETYYRNKGCNVYKFPTIIDFKNDYTKRASFAHEKIRLIYFGNAGKKDILSNVIIALSMLPTVQRDKFELSIYGTDEKCLVDKQKLDPIILNRLINKNVFFRGRISHTDLEAKLYESDFSVLLRRNERCANAGFPTKVGESMASGIPVICNLTGDLKEYLEDGVSCILARSESPEDFKLALERVASMSKSEIETMKDIARIRAESVFNLDTYSEEMYQFIKSI